MPSDEHAEVIIELTTGAPLAEVMPLPRTDQTSFYKRNSGMLPRLGDTAPGRYSRASLPTPVEPEPDTLVNRIKEFINANRPSWLPQR